MIPVLFLFIGAVCAALGWVVIRRLWSFQAQDTDDYIGQGPDFDIRKRLNGPILCEGVIYGPAGRVVARFVADMQAEWDGDRGTMTEQFRYDNGSIQNRCWHLTVLPDGRIEADAADVIGKGAGRQGGPGVCLRYRIQLPEASGGHRLNVIDWMYLLENGTIMNRSQFRKYGVKVAELVATMRPAAA